jgi:hypothetical protein
LVKSFEFIRQIFIVFFFQHDVLNGNNGHCLLYSPREYQWEGRHSLPSDSWKTSLHPNYKNVFTSRKDSVKKSLPFPELVFLDLAKQ